MPFYEAKGPLLQVPLSQGELNEVKLGIIIRVKARFMRCRKLSPPIIGGVEVAVLFVIRYLLFTIRYSLYPLSPYHIKKCYLIKCIGVHGSREGVSVVLIP